MSTQGANHKRGFLALSPILVFLGAYLVSSLAAGDFYRIPVSSAFLLASIYAFIITPGKIQERAAAFSEGAGNGNVLMMVLIFILAGAFASTAKQIGAIEATVNLTLSIIPGKLIFAGLFLTACFISFAIGTSVGTIVALMPIAAGVASETGCDMAMMAATIVGGAFFGDNLSFISDTTIAATSSQGCNMRDKFRENIKVVIPAVAVVLGIYLFQGMNGSISADQGAIDLVKLLPYLTVIALAIAGLNVLIILTVGIAANAVTGFATSSLSWTEWLESTGSGIAGMGELIIVTLLAGGMLSLIRKGGGLDYLISLQTRHIKGSRGAMLSIAGMVSFANLCTANNTIAILTTGEIARTLSRTFKIDARKTASILDTFSCTVQGLIPYGAQLLMAASLSGIPATAIIPKLYYPMILGACAIMAVLLPGKAK